MNPTMTQTRSETVRWFLLLTANVSRPAGVYPEAMMTVIQASYPDATLREVYLALDYLQECGIVQMERDGLTRWFVLPTREGVDVVEYGAECPAGISRPRLTQAQALAA